MRPFTTHIYDFSQRQFPLQVIKATKYSTYFIIHNPYDIAAKYSIISTEKNVKLSYLVGSVDKNNVYFHMTCFLPKYWKLLPPSHTFIDHAVIHKKLQIINFAVCLKYRKRKKKINLQWNNRSWQGDWN